MGGSNKVVDTTPQDITGLRNQLATYLGSGGGNPTGTGGGSLPGQSGMTPGGGGFGGGTIQPDVASVLKMFQGAPGVINGAPAPGGPQPAGTATGTLSTPSVMPQPNQFGTGTGLDRSQAVIGQGGGYVGDQSAPTVSQVDPVTGLPRSAISNVASQNVGAGSDPWNQISGLISQYANQAKGVAAPTMGAAPSTQSVDQLGGANSAFFQNMVAQLQPSFTAQRAGDLAQAKEAMGNLTGSGAGNALGASVNRSLGAEQAQLANYATQGLQTEVQRQIANQQVGSNQNIALAGDQTQAGIAGLNNIASLYGQTGQNLTSLAGTNANLNLQGQGMNQTADQNWVAQMNQIAAQNADRSQGANNLLAQLQQTTGAQNQAVNQGAVTNQFNTNAQTAAQNAQNFMQLLNSMTQGGVAPSTVVHTPGLGETLGNIAGTAVGAYVGKKA